jgi:hypothetical protein
MVKTRVDFQDKLSGPIRLVQIEASPSPLFRGRITSSFALPVDFMSFR